MQKTLRSLQLKQTISAQMDKVCELVKDENRQHRNDLNNDLEDIFEFILNRVTPGGSYKNLNLGTSQKPGIDLGDPSTKISYQVTSEDRASKIHDCLDKFEEHKLYKEYDTLVILFANSYKPDLKKIKFSTGYSFKPSDVLQTMNKDQLQAEIEKADVYKLMEITEYLETQLAPYVNDLNAGISVINDILDACLEQIEKSDGLINIDQSMPILVRKKIELNFEDEDDADQISDYMQDALRHSDSVASIINARPDLDPADIELYIKDMYNEYKHKHNNPMLTMLSLFDGIIPTKKRNDIAYKTWARRFILKYFEDCSIFKKTKEEKELIYKDGHTL